MTSLNLFHTKLWNNVTRCFTPSRTKNTVQLELEIRARNFGHEDETNYETDEISKENMREFCMFIADQKSENTKHTTKYDKQTLYKFCREKNE